LEKERIWVVVSLTKGATESRNVASGAVNRKVLFFGLECYIPGIGKENALLPVVIGQASIQQMSHLFTTVIKGDANNYKAP
jgi:hypothetical protein